MTCGVIFTSFKVETAAHVRHHSSGRSFPQVEEMENVPASLMESSRRGDRIDRMDSELMSDKTSRLIHSGQNHTV